MSARRSPVAIVLGIILAVLGILGIAGGGGGAGPFFPLIFGVFLVFMGLRWERRRLIIFGHVCIATGCYLVAWGVYLAQIVGSAPTWLQVITQPLFWGLFSIFGGICATFHGFCSCMQHRSSEGGKTPCRS